MKKLILYPSLVILFILVLISFRFGKGKETVNVQMLENKKETEETTRGIPVFPMEQGAQAQLPLSESKPAITIINARTPVKEAFSLNQDGRKVTKKKMPGQELSEPSSSLGVEGNAGEDTISQESENESGGITKIEKYPSETEQKEMNEHGIVMY